MRKTSLVLVFAFATSGCVSFNQQTIDTKSVADIKGQTLTYTARKNPDFAAMTAGKAAFALLGAIAMISEGNSIVASNNVADPADAIAMGLSKALENAHEVRLVTPPAMVNTDDVAQVAASVSGAARFVVDVQTVN